jgi:hypothetical protein
MEILSALGTSNILICRHNILEGKKWTVSSLFNSVFQIVGNCLRTYYEGEDYDQIQYNFGKCASKYWKQLTENGICVTGTPLDTRINHHFNASLQHYRYTKLVCCEKSPENLDAGTQFSGLLLYRMYVILLYQLQSILFCFPNPHNQMWTHGGWLCFHIITINGRNT